MNCLYCGAPVDRYGNCPACGMKQEYLIKARNTSSYYYNQGLTYARLRNLTGAKRALKTALHYSKTNVDARNLLGLVYFETGQIADALTQWVISSSIRPTDNLAVEYLEKVQGDQSKLDAYDQSAKSYNLALKHARRHNFDLALIQLKKVLSLNPKYVKAYLVLALIYMDQMDFTRARKALNRAQKIDHMNPRVIHFLSEINKVDKRKGAAYGDPSESFRDDFGWEDEYEGEEDSEELALRKLKEVVERGAAAEDIGSESDLEVSSYKDIKLWKHNLLYMAIGVGMGLISALLLFLPGWVHKSGEKKDEQISTIQAELSAKNENIRLLEEEVAQKDAERQSVADEYAAYKAANSAQAADETWMTALQLYFAADYKGALEKLSAFDLAEGDMSESSKAVANHILENCGDELAAYREAGMAAFEEGKYEDAVTNLSVYAKLKPDDAEARFKLAKSYEQLGQVELAHPLYQDINTRFPDSEYVTTEFQ